MRHIKLFESFSDNKFYSKINRIDTYDLEPVDFDDREVEKIKHLLSQKGIEESKSNVLHIEHPSTIYSDTSSTMGGTDKYWMWSKSYTKMSTISGIPQFVQIEPVGVIAIYDLYKKWFIEKVEDEYFIVTGFKHNRPDDVYKIDQIDGLLEFLDKYIQEK